VNRRSVTRALLVVAALLLVACGEGSNLQVASNAKADRQTPAASTPDAPDKAVDDEAADKPPTTKAVVGATIALQDDVFVPADVEIAAGEAVAWKWEGKNPHNVAGSGFKSKIQTSGTFTRTFAKAGSFDYRCEVHPVMTGTVVVTG
jgi:plastocyanin